MPKLPSKTNNHPPPKANTIIKVEQSHIFLHLPHILMQTDHLIVQLLNSNFLIES